MEREFWIGFLQIIWIDVLLSGDNAVVIALVCRSLPSKQRVAGIALGAGAAIGLRIVFATFIAYLMAGPLSRSSAASCCSGSRSSSWHPRKTAAPLRPPPRAYGPPSASSSSPTP